MERFNQCQTLFNNRKKTHDFQTENDIATLDWIETGVLFWGSEVDGTQNSTFPSDLFIVH